MLESFLDANYWKAIMMLITLLEAIQGANNSTIMYSTFTHDVKYSTGGLMKNTICTYSRITHHVNTGAMIENTQITNYSTEGMLETSHNK